MITAKNIILEYLDTVIYKYWERHVGSIEFYKVSTRGSDSSFVFTSVDSLPVINKKGDSIKCKLHVEYYPTKNAYKAFLTDEGVLSPSTYSRGLSFLVVRGPVDIDAKSFHFGTGYISKQKMLKLIDSTGRLEKPVARELLLSIGWKSFS